MSEIMKRLSSGILLALLLGVLYLACWPVRVAPVAWNPPAAPALEGTYAPNRALAEIERIGDGVGPKPEDVALDRTGRIYAGFEDGRIMRWDARGENPDVFANTNGRPLGLHFDPNWNLLVADSYKGLLRIDEEGGKEFLSSSHGGIPYRFTNDVDVAADGTIYFTDASHKFGQTEFVDDLMEHGGHGRLLAYHLDSGRTELLLDGLQFANGVAIDPDQQFVLVNETGAYRVRKYWIAGPKQGRDEIFIDNLPGFPDGISTGADGVFWVAIASPRKPLMDNLAQSPFLRKVVMRLPAFLRPKPVQYAFVLGIDAEGNVLHNLQDPDGAYAPITSVQEHDGKLYFGSIIESAIGRMDVPSGGAH